MLGQIIPALSSYQNNKFGDGGGDRNDVIAVLLYKILKTDTNKKKENWRVFPFLGFSLPNEIRNRNLIM